MSRKSTAVLAIFGVSVVATIMMGCNGFFVSPNSVASIIVSPTSAVLGTSGGTLQMSANTLLVNSNNSSCTSTSWKSSDPTNSVITIDPSSGLVTPVAPGQVTVTVNCDGTTSSAIPIDVFSGGAIAGITINLSSTTASAGQTVTASVVTSQSAVTIPTQYVNWTFPSGTTNTLSTNSVSITFLTTASLGTSATISASVITNGGSTVSAPQQSITIN
jgi:uncharacterized protein YcfL